MKVIDDKYRQEDQNKSDADAKVLNNLFRCLTILEKTLERPARQRRYGKNQYPEIYSEIPAAVIPVRTWAEDHKIYYRLSVFSGHFGNVYHKYCRSSLHFY